MLRSSGREMLNIHPCNSSAVGDQHPFFLACAAALSFSIALCLCAGVGGVQYTFFPPLCTVTVSTTYQTISQCISLITAFLCV